MDLLRQVHERNLVRWAKDKPEVVVFSGDLTGSTEIRAFRDAYPGRFFSLGMAEQNMMSWAGGMAREGYSPFIHTFAVFLYRRALDQIEMSIAYPNLRVRMFGFLPGITTPGGVSHQAIDDIAVLRGLPNMTILETGDATDVESVLDTAHGIDGPVYVRMIRKEIPRLFPSDQPMELNKVRRIREGTDVTVITSGICTEEAMRAAAALESRGLSVEHLHATTIKPFSDPQVVESCARAKYGVVTLENHNVMGGLGTSVAELMAEHGIGKRLVKLGLFDTYAHGASREYLMKEYHLDALSLVERLEELTEERFGISEEELTAVRVSDFNSEGQLEAL
ncbi:MAG: transketolase [Spirochaetales bacterium]|nr:transketolase [Spirochaetales bacterium]MCF7937510.1 transketolase [Spirochaetales bacterium]